MTPVRILVIGGTGFVSSYVVRRAVERGHTVSVLHRGAAAPSVADSVVAHLRGDLGGDPTVLAGRSFDVVVDVPTTFPAWVRNSARYLAGNVGHYVFVSTVSVYPSATRMATEEDPTTPMPVGLDPWTVRAEDRARYYGALKARAELEVEAHYAGRTTIIRPGLVAGPGDPSFRYTYWPVRLARGGDVLAPGRPDDAVQYIDVRDLSEWTVDLAERGVCGVFNATGPDTPLTMGGMLTQIARAVGGEARLHWAAEGFLARHGISAWRDMPVWQGAEFVRRSVARASREGLTFRPVAVTAADTLAWWRSLPASTRDRNAGGEPNGLSASREASVLEAWRAAVD